MPPLEPPTEQQRGRSWGPLPPQTVFALFEGPGQAEQAKQRLIQAGIGEAQIRILEGEQGAAALEPDRDENGRPSFLSRALAELTDETTYLESYAKSLREGKVLTAVGYEAESKEQAESDRMTIEAILIDSGGLHMSYTSDWTLTAVGKR